MKKDEPEEIPLEQIEAALVQIGDAIKKLASTRVSKKLIVALIRDDTKLTKGTIEHVLNSLEFLESRYLKARKS